jgi:GNAT superfamily N-acetyltransferase
MAMTGNGGQSMIPLNLDGLTPVPSGKVPAIVTHLAMGRPAPIARAQALPPGVTLERLRGGAVVRYLALFRAVGAPWLWVSRLRLPEAKVAATLEDERCEAYAVMRGGREIGLVELDATKAQETELVYFGLMREATGQGLGKALMQAAIRLAFMRPIDRLTVHTCTLDAANALPFYLRMGFAPVRQEIELIDDPRLSGLLPEDCAPQIPLIAPPQT